MKICCIFKLSQIKMCILFIYLFHVRGMICFIEKYEDFFGRIQGGQVPPVPFWLRPCILVHKYTYTYFQRHYYRCIHTYVYVHFHIHAYANKYSYTHLNKHPLRISNSTVFFQNDFLQKNNTNKVYMLVQFIRIYMS